MISVYNKVTKYPSLNAEKYFLKYIKLMTFCAFLCFFYRHKYILQLRNLYEIYTKLFCSTFFVLSFLVKHKLLCFCEHWPYASKQSITGEWNKTYFDIINVYVRKHMIQCRSRPRVITMECRTIASFSVTMGIVLGVGMDDHEKNETNPLSPHNFKVL